MGVGGKEELKGGEKQKSHLCEPFWLVSGSYYFLVQGFPWKQRVNSEQDGEMLRELNVQGRQGCLRLEEGEQKGQVSNRTNKTSLASP